jgi:lipopolysaccharide transport system ATP-binding protein
MSVPAIHVDQVSKQYRLGTQASYLRFSESLQHTVVRSLTAPVRHLRSRQAQPDLPRAIWALQNVSFTVPQGETLGIIGRNGAGKSTLLKLLSRITRPTEGRVGVCGRVGSLLEVGTGFHPELTGRENVYLNGAVLGMSRSEVRRKFDAIVGFSEVETFLDTPVKRYSSGMYVRLAFAVAAHLEPDVLVVDEVLAVGDAAFRKKCLGKMDEIGREGRTVILVSHNMSTIAGQCRRVILLDDGQIAAEGTPEEVIPGYLSTMSEQGAGEITWEELDSAPGSEYVRLRAVRLRQSAESVAAATIDIGEPLQIEIEYEVLRDKTSLYAGIFLKTVAQEFVLSSFNAPSVTLTPDEWYDRPLAAGRYRSTCTLPANFLNDTSYTITANVGRILGRPDIHAENVLTFDGHDSGAMRQEYSGNWAGPVIRPRLAWQTEPASAPTGVD